MATKTATSKSTKVKAIPDGYHSVTPYLIIDGAARAIDFYKRAFDAKELMRIPSPGDKIGHAEIKIGDSVIMLADEHPEMDARSPAHFGGSPVSIMIYVEDVDQPVQAGHRGRRHRGAPADRPVLRRPLGHAQGPLRPQLAPLHAQGRRQHGRNEPPHGRHEERLARGQVLHYDIF